MVYEFGLLNRRRLDSSESTDLGTRQPVSKGAGPHDSVRRSRGLRCQPLTRDRQIGAPAPNCGHAGVERYAVVREGNHFAEPVGVRVVDGTQVRRNGPQPAAATRAGADTVRYGCAGRPWESATRRRAADRLGFPRNAPHTASPVASWCPPRGRNRSP